MSLDEIMVSIRVAVACIVFACFVFAPLKSRFRHGRGRTALCVAALILYTVGTTIVFLTPGRFLSSYNLWGILLWICIAVAVFGITIRGSRFELLFIVLVAMNLYVNMMAVTKVIVFIHLKSMPEAAAQTLVSFGVLVAYIPFLWVLFSRLFRQVVELNISRSFWRVIWIIPALTYVVFYIKIVNDYWKSPVDIESGDILFSAMWSIVTSAFFFVTLVMLLQAYKGIAAAEKTKLVTSQLQMQEERYESLKRHIEDTAKLRHDWRHHLLVISGFADGGSLGEIQEYLRQLAPAYRSEMEAPICENDVVDVILRHYRALADDQGIQMHIQADIPAELAIEETDLGSVFGNLTENAVHACRGQQEGERIIDIRAGVKGSQLIVILKNTYENKVIEKGGRYISTKHKGEGNGIASVSQVVEKYGGMIRISYDENYFNVSLFMNQKETQPVL